MCVRKIIVIAGPTAVGKTEYATEIAKRFNGEIVSADSMQLYKYMNVGSAKPGKKELLSVRHHLIDEIDPREPFSVAQYQKLAKSAISDIFARGGQPVVSGGTGLYINSLIYDMDFSAPPPASGYRRELETLAAANGNEYIHKRLAEKDPDAAGRIHPNNLKRMIRALEVAENSDGRIAPFENSFVKTKDYETELICLNRERQELYTRINSRVDNMFESGLLQEVEELRRMGLTSEDVSMKGIGYKEVMAHLRGDYDISEAGRLVKRNTRHYAKRQITWFKRYAGMTWFNLSGYESAGDALEDIISWLIKRK